MPPLSSNQEVGLLLGVYGTLAVMFLAILFGAIGGVVVGFLLVGGH